MHPQIRHPHSRTMGQPCAEDALLPRSPCRVLTHPEPVSRCQPDVRGARRRPKTTLQPCPFEKGHAGLMPNVQHALLSRGLTAQTHKAMPQAASQVVQVSPGRRCRPAGHKPDPNLAAQSDLRQNVPKDSEEEHKEPPEWEGNLPASPQGCPWRSSWPTPA